MNRIARPAGLILVSLMCLVSMLTLGCTTEAAFEVRLLVVNPSETDVGEEAVVTGIVRNDGGADGTYEAILTVDGDEVARQSLVIEARTVETATFTLTQDTAGTYEVGLGDMRATLVVAEPEVVEEEEPAAGEQTTAPDEEPEPEEVAEEEPIEEPTVEEKPDAATLGERNALGKALDYLNYTSFSYSGLVEQLEFEGYTHKEAVYGVDNCGADWSEQAALKAKDYLDYSSFSRDGLIAQLEFEGFTRHEAVYGVDVCGADWNEQAALKAKEYLDYSSFSRDGLIDQLEFEGFTRQQAEYGARAVGY